MTNPRIWEKNKHEIAYQKDMIVRVEGYLSEAMKDRKKNEHELLRLNEQKNEAKEKLNQLEEFNKKVDTYKEYKIKLPQTKKELQLFYGFISKTEVEVHHI